MNKIFFTILLVIVILSLGITSVSAGTLKEDIQAYYKLDETSGTKAIDWVRGLHNGTVGAGVTIGQEGILNRSYNFTNGGSGAVTGLGTPLPTGNDARSISLWVKVDDISSEFGHIPLYKAGGTNLGEDFSISIRGGDKVYIRRSTHDVRTVTTRFNSDSWIHIVISYNGTSSHSVDFFVNGSKVANERTFSDDVTFATSVGSQAIGINSLSSYYPTLTTIDEVSIFNRSLTEEEVISLYGSGIPPPYPFGLADIDITLNNPTNNTFSINRTVFFNSTLIPLYTNITNATIFVWNSTGSLINKTVNNFAGTNNLTIITNWTINFEDYGSYFWTVLGGAYNTTDSISILKDSNFTFTLRNFVVIDQNYSQSVYDTSNQTFLINITLDQSAELFSSSLWYNGSYYLGEITNLGDGSYSIKRSIDIPVVDATADKQFNWTLTLDLGEGFSIRTTEYETQEVKPSLYESKSTGTVKYIIMNEENLQNISAYFDGSSYWYLGGGTVIKNTSFDITNPTNSFFFNSTPFNEIMYLSSKILIKNESVGAELSNRLFEFNKEQIFNNTKIYELLLANSSLSRDIIIEVKDEGLNPLQNTLVVAERYYPSINKYKMTESRITDNFGQFTGRFVENDVIYRFKFYDSNNNLLKIEDRITISCRTVICILPFVIEDTEDLFERFSPIDGFDYSFKFSTSNNRFTYTWNDNTEKFSSARLEVTRFLFNGSTTVCDSSSTENPKTLTCNVGDSKASYVAEIFRTDNSGKEIRIDSLSIKVGDVSATFGLEGLMWSFLLLMIMITFGLYSPPVGIVLYLFGFIILAISGIIYVYPALLIGNLILGVLFIWAFKGG